MAESGCLRRPQKLLSDSDMAAAAQQLMQLSDEDNNSCEYNSHENKNNNKEKNLGDKNEITWAKIEEIFGKEEGIYRPKKKRYRSLVSIYMRTKPIPPEMMRRSRH